MAANVLVNPPGDWFAHMHEEADARALFEHAVELGLAAIPPDADSLHPLRTSHRGSLGPMGLAGVAWDAAEGGDGSKAGGPVDGEEADRRAGEWTDALYSGTTVAEMVRPVARWWRGRMGLSKEEQQRIYLEIDPTADLGHAKLSAKLMGGSDRH
ncbi:hypothetical protein FNF27_04241 [Cafeteria roenbergensis]|uniref:Uncharacterized protein n=2 Tax=Cafeteria roenbergensis TaxID=33653 RepID=A0A5A8DNN9_CAFRO|nr:hypothetical protein FNF29_02675 [Cafeteria roenbergensis]KAA0159701.1 hypothetical protein FNF28_05761 [Cafeteria roenbergensis]KAA0166789.1 hypothetical protein FNF31_01164 [Cafeteria roenbergensis]KAA0174229.1 hypothetical protein FNF27_04241 [Cafeteria roenbergensis]|eukprot:KAA0154052.1 hypothetical protein FNF29_02675 [Cafeteria roenbergensis]